MEIIYYHKIQNAYQNDIIKSICQNYISSHISKFNVVLESAKRILAKCNIGKYLTITGSRDFVDDGVVVRNISVWNSEPNTYPSVKDKKLINGFPSFIQLENKFADFVITLEHEICKDICYSNSNQNGKDQNQLQGEENPDSGYYEGCILHSRRVRPQLAAGRHCNEAKIEIQGTRVRRGQIYLSSRCPEVLSSGLRD